MCDSISTDVKGACLGGAKTPPPPVLAPTSLVSKQTAYMLLALGEGEIDSISNIYFDEVDIQTYTASFVYTRGTENQPIITGFSDAPLSTSNNTPIVLWTTQPDTTTGTPGVPSYGVTVDCQATTNYVELTIRLDSVETVDTSGNRLQAAIGFYIFVSKNIGGVYDWSLIPPMWAARAGRTTSPFAFTTRVDKPATYSATDPWSIRIYRAVPDDGQAIGNGTTLYCKSFLQSYTQYTVQPDINYPYTALLGVRVEDASQLNGSIPVVSALVKGMKLVLPDNYDPVTRTRVGTWTGGFATSLGLPRLQYSNNLAWCIYNLLSDHHVMTVDGVSYPRFFHIDRNWIAKFTFEAFAQYCDVLLPYVDAAGTTRYEPRYTCNGQFLERMTASEFKDIFLSIGNAKLIEQDGLVSITWDRAYTTNEIDRAPLFTNDNVIEGLFEYSTSHISENYTQVNVTIQDVTNKNKVRTVTVDSTELEVFQGKPTGYYTNLYGWLATDITLQGVTSYAAAKRKARSLLWDSLENNEFVAFKTLVAGANLSIGQIIRVNDSGIMGVVGNGRLSSVSQNSTKLQLDLGQGVTLAGSTYLSTYLEDGTLCKLLLQETAGTFQVVTVAKTSATPLVFADAALWVLHTSNLQVWKVISIMQSSEHWEVAAMRYNSAKFEFIDSVVGEQPKVLHQATTVLPRLLAPTNLTVNPTVSATTTGVLISWVGVAGVVQPPTYTIVAQLEQLDGTIAGRVVTTGAFAYVTDVTLAWNMAMDLTGTMANAGLFRPLRVTITLVAEDIGSSLPSIPVSRTLIINA